MQPSKMSFFVCNSESQGEFLWSMVIFISSTSIVAEYGVVIPSPTPIMEDTSAYVPPQAMVAEEAKEIPLIHEVRLRPDPPDTSNKKVSSSCKKEAPPLLKFEEL